MLAVTIVGESTIATVPAPARLPTIILKMLMPQLPCRISKQCSLFSKRFIFDFAVVFSIIAVVWGMSVVSIMIFFVFRTWAVLFKIIAVIV